MTARRWAVLADLAALWGLLFGLWPLLDTGHDADAGLLGAVDFAVHVLAGGFLASRWMLVRRTPRPARHEHVWVLRGYGGAGWSVYQCACGASEVAP